MKRFDLDVKYYRKAYPDLRNKNDHQLQSHWKHYGKKEKRLPNRNLFHRECPTWEHSNSKNIMLEEAQATYWHENYLLELSRLPLFLTELWYNQSVLPVLGPEAPTFREFEIWVQQEQDENCSSDEDRDETRCQNEIGLDHLNRYLQIHRHHRINNITESELLIVIPIFKKGKILSKTIPAYISLGIRDQCIFIVSELEDLLHIVEFWEGIPNYIFSQNLPLSQKINNGIWNLTLFLEFEYLVGLPAVPVGSRGS